MTKYRQCELRKSMGDGQTVSQVSYIPTKFAVVGRTLKLRNESKSWDDGWVVISVGLIENAPTDARAKIKSHRRATGDSLRR